MQRHCLWLANQRPSGKSGNSVPACAKPNESHWPGRFLDGMSDGNSLQAALQLLILVTNKICLGANPQTHCLRRQTHVNNDTKY